MVNKCVKCGHENPAGVAICVQCATPLSRICQNCGFENPTNFKFCGNCGATLVAPNPDASTVQTPQPAAASIPTALVEKITLAGKQIEGERREVTVLFADLSGFTSISEKLDPEQVFNFISPTIEAFIQEIYKHEGWLDKRTGIMGDGVMAIFGAPIAHEDDPARAVRTALGMQDALKRINEHLNQEQGFALRVRIGLNSGTVVVGSIGSDLSMQYTAIGDTVNVASRLQTVAEPGTILVSRSVFDQTKPLFEFHERGAVQVKGREEPVEIFNLIGPRLKAERVRGIPGLSAPMVGREEEFARVRHTVDELVTDGGKIVLVTGEAGIGKSRLTFELKQYLANKPVRFLEGACLSYGQSAYAIFMQLLKSLCAIGEGETEDAIREKIERTIKSILPSDYAVPDVLPYIENLFGIRIVDKELSNRIRHLEPAQLQQQTFLAIRDLFAAAAKQKPLILIFEDIHWIDKLSLDLLTFILSAVENLPLLLYCNSRPADGAAAPQIRRLGKELYDSHFLHLPLSPLSRADSVALIDMLLTISELPPQLKQIIPQRAEGNPFYLEEMIRILIDRAIIRREGDHWMMSPDANLTTLEVPRTLQGLIMARVDHLSEGSRQAIHSAAVIGRDFPYRLLSAVLDGTRNLQNDVRELEERELINHVADTPDLEYRFHHVLIQETVYNNLLTRRRERLHHNTAEAIEMLYKDRLEEHTERLAFHYTESKDMVHALPHLIRAGDRAANRFANDEAIRHYRLAADSLSKAQPELRQRIEVYRGLGQVQTFVGDYDGSLNSYLVALEMIPTVGNPEPRTRAEIMRRIGRVHERRGDYAEALRWLENALSELDLDGDSGKAVERARTYLDIGWVHYRRGQSEEAYQWRMRSLQIVEGTDYYNEMASAYNGLTALFNQKGDWARSIAYAEKGLRLREMIGDSHGMAQSFNQLGVIARRQCDWDRAIHHFERALEIRQRIGDIEGISRTNNNLGIPYMYKGDYSRARELFQKGLEIAEKIKNGNSIIIALNNLAEVKTLQGDFDSAVLFANRSVNLATEMRSKELLASGHWALSEAFLGKDQIEQAENYARQAHSTATEIGPQLEGQVLRTLGKISRAKKNLDVAEDHLRRSLTIFSELENPFDLAQSQHQLALLQREQGHSTEARTTLETAYATFARLGAEGERQRARADLDRIASSIPHVPKN